MVFFRLEKRQLEHEEIWRRLEELHLKHNQKLALQAPNDQNKSIQIKRK